MKYKDNWDDTRARFEAWWKGSSIGRPMMRVIAKRSEPAEALEGDVDYADANDRYLNVAKNVRRYRNFCRTHRFLAEAYPHMNVDLGPGSMALYLGSEPIFKPQTVWYTECLGELEEAQRLRYDPENRWWKKHLEMAREAVKLSGGDFYVDIPDVFENIDILQLLRGAQNLCFDMIDEPDQVKKTLARLDSWYFRYIDAMYDLVKDADGASSYTVFDIWGPGKTIKVQCDFSAVMSPKQFRGFVLPSLQEECSKLDFSLYHLDGPDAIKHVDAIMEIKNLHALQWTCGAGQPDGGCERWFPIYEKVRAAGKSLWIQIYDGGFDEWVKSAERLCRTFGRDGLYLVFPIMEEDQAHRLIETANERWS